MVRESNTSIFESKADIIVNPVNTVGVMGAGLAAKFKAKYPGMFKSYALACRLGELKLGKVWLWHTDGDSGPYWVCCFPTKRHWRDKSNIQDIAAGLVGLDWNMRRMLAKSVALPLLGCGLGGLRRENVTSMIYSVFSMAQDIDVTIHIPTA